MYLIVCKKLSSRLNFENDKISKIRAGGLRAFIMRLFSQGIKKALTLLCVNALNFLFSCFRFGLCLLPALGGLTFPYLAVGALDCIVVST